METKEKNLMDVYFHMTPAYTPRRDSWNGVNYVIVPVAMMVEGVHSGSHGPVLHTAEELGKIPETWNGMPVTLRHPQVNGQYVSATSPEVLKDWGIGIVFNTRMDGETLRAEAWIEEDKLQTLSAATLQRINNGEIIEVSVGVFSDEEVIDGTWNGETYQAIARNHRPNHLALLPDEVGACSIADGCGLRVNRRGDKKVEVIVNETNERQVLKELSMKGFSVNEVGYTELANKAQTALNNKDNEMSYYYLEEIFDNNMVYRVNTRMDDGTRTSKFYKQSYQVNAAGEVELIGEAVQVKRVVEYPPVVNVNTAINNNKKSGGDDMSEKCTPCVKAAVDGLIANKATAYAETDREWLEALSESQLEKMNPPAPQVNTTTVTKEQALQVLSGLTMNEYLATMPVEIREQVQTGLRIHAERKASMVSTITANADSPWTKEELEAMAMPMLEKVFLTVNKKNETNFSIFGTGFEPTPKVEKVDVLLPMGIE